MVRKLYNLKKDSVYIRKGASFSDFVLMAFDELFPDGGRISEENCLTISNYLKEKYDVDVELVPHIYKLISLEITTVLSIGVHLSIETTQRLLAKN